MTGIVIHSIATLMGPFKRAILVYYYEYEHCLYTTWAGGQYRNYSPREDKKKSRPRAEGPRAGFFCPPEGYNSYIARQPM